MATRYGDDRSRRSAPVLSVAPDYELKRAAAQEWYQTWIKTRSLQEHLGVDRSNHQSIVAMATDEMPSVLGEWGCTHELWARIRNKRVLLEYAESGDEAKARERLKMLRHSRSVLGISTPMPALLATVGCDEALWAQIRSKASLVQLAEAGDEAGLRAKLLDPRRLDQGIGERLRVASRIVSNHTRGQAKLCVSETGGAYNSGQSGVTDAFGSAFW